MRELNNINSWLGGHRVTLAGFRRLLGSRRQVTVCEIGCGGGDNLLAIYKWCLKRNISVRLVGIDYNSDCIEIARQVLPAENSQLLISDYRQAVFSDTGKPDIIFSSLFCHHFTDPELVTMLGWMRANARAGFFINDLHRHFLAFYSIKLLTRIFSKSYLVKNDAPLSVQRGFTGNEWHSLLERAGIDRHRVNWKWAFRWLVTSEAI
jgi:2-polyprenyl-3-methyl-5-hydroxy-6-metoxy-1,4-benzoquinol methylase